MQQIFNSSWWAGALLQRAQLVRDANKMRAAAGAPTQDLECDILHTPGHELTDWEKNWIRERLLDRYLQAANERDEALAFQAMDVDAHVTDELARRAPRQHIAREQHAATKAFLAKHPNDETAKHMLTVLEEELVWTARNHATIRAEHAQKAEMHAKNIEIFDRICETHFDTHLANFHDLTRDHIRAMVQGLPFPPETVAETAEVPAPDASAVAFDEPATFDEREEPSVILHIHDDEE